MTPFDDASAGGGRPYDARAREAEILASFPALPVPAPVPEMVSQAALFRVYPNADDELGFRSWAGAGRWVYNRCHEFNQDLYAKEKRFAFHGELSARLPDLKRTEGLEWLNGPPAIHLVDACRRYDAALRRYLSDREKVKAGRLAKSKAAGFPKFKSRREGLGSIYLSPQSFKLIRRSGTTKARGWIELPNLDETVTWERERCCGVVERRTVGLRQGIRIRGGRWPEGTIRSATLTRHGDAWFLSVQFDGPPPKLTQRQRDALGAVAKAAGYDVGGRDLIHGSNDLVVPCGRHLKKRQKRLRRAQKAASRRYEARKAREARLRERAKQTKTEAGPEPGKEKETTKAHKSRREMEARRQVAGLHRKVGYARSDEQHKASHRATAKAGTVCVEGLNVKGMMSNRRTAGTMSDAGVGEVLRQVRYKAQWRGRHHVAIGRYEASSKTCNLCDHVHQDLGSEKVWTCPGCGARHDRDRNASLNILRWGLRDLIRRGTPECRPVEDGALAAKPARKGKGLRRNSVRRSGNVATTPAPVAA